MIVYLSSDDIAEAEIVADFLSTIWEGKRRQTFEGLKAECAAIKYFNYYLGATNKISFNTCYSQNGGDGGFDFRWPPDLKWDVKSVAGSNLIESKNLKTKAHCIFLVRRMSENAYKIVGFCPVSKLPKKEYLEDDAFHDPKLLIRLFPRSFDGDRFLLNESVLNLETLLPARAVMSKVFRRIEKENKLANNKDI